MSVTELLDALKKQATEVAKDLGFFREEATKTDLPDLATSLAQMGDKLIRWNIILAGVVIAAIGLIVRL